MDKHYTTPVYVINELVEPIFERKMELVIPDLDAFDQWVQEHQEEYGTYELDEWEDGFMIQLNDEEEGREERFHEFIKLLSPWELVMMS